MVHPSKDTIVVSGKTIKPFQDLVYVMFNKPPRIVTTMNDPDGRPSVADYFEKARVRMFPVGRLDWDSEGLLLLTNDGDFAQRVSHPKSSIAKTYLVKVDGQPTHEDMQKLMRGVSIIGGRAFALLAETAERKSSEKYDWVKVIINEGRNRQIRQMFEKIGYDVMKLQRVAIGRLRLGTLEKGKFRILTDEDLARIFSEPKELDERNRKREEYRRAHGLNEGVKTVRRTTTRGPDSFRGPRPERDSEETPRRTPTGRPSHHGKRDVRTSRGGRPSSDSRPPRRDSEESPRRPSTGRPNHHGKRDGGPRKFKRERD